MKKRVKQRKPEVAIVMGSDSDLPVMREAVQALEEFGIANELLIMSAHRTPYELARFAESARKRGLRVMIAGAGGAAHLPGVIAAHTELPVIGVPVPTGPLHGQDALLSIVQMPRGVPVATVAIGSAYNAGVLAAQILAAGGKAADPKMMGKVIAFKENLRKKALAKNAAQRSN